MIIGVFGDPRAGKSLHVVEHFLIDALKNNIHVFCNIEGVNVYAIQQLYGTPEKPIRTELYHPISPYCWDAWTIEEELDERRMIILDEVQNLYSTEVFKTHPERRRELQKYLTTHGHRGDSVVWICPNPDQVDANFRRLCEHWLYVRKLNFLPKMLGGGTNKYVVLQNKQYTRKGPFMKRTQYTYNPLTQLCYRSRDVGREEIKTDADEVSASALKIIWPILLAVLCAILAIGYYVKEHYFHKKETTAQTVQNTGKQNDNATNPSAEIEANGWIVDEDSICVDWLQNASRVASTCPVPSRFGGRTPATYPNGQNVVVFVKAGASVGPANVGTGTGVESPGTGTANGSSAPIGVPLSLGSGK